MTISPVVFADNLSSYDVRFIDAMTMHHDGAIKMARMALDKAQHAPLRQLAQKMIDDQKNEIETMKGWRDPWAKGMPQSDPMPMPGMMPDTEMQKMMSALQSAQGNDFDLAFTESMVKHHQSAIMMAQDALSKASSDEIKGLAKKIVSAQKKEQATLRRWHRQWEKGSSTTTHRRMEKE